MSSTYYNYFRVKNNALITKKSTYRNKTTNSCYICINEKYFKVKISEIEIFRIEIFKFENLKLKITEF